MNQQKFINYIIIITLFCWNGIVFTLNVKEFSLPNRFFSPEFPNEHQTNIRDSCIQDIRCDVCHTEIFMSSRIMNHIVYFLTLPGLGEHRIRKMVEKSTLIQTASQECQLNHFIPGDCSLPAYKYHSSLYVSRNIKDIPLNSSILYIYRDPLQAVVSAYLTETACNLLRCQQEIEFNNEWEIFMTQYLYAWITMHSSVIEYSSLYKVKTIQYDQLQEQKLIMLKWITSELGNEDYIPDPIRSLACHSKMTLPRSRLFTNPFKREEYKKQACSIVGKYSKQC
jgi:hypothetical protein